MGSTHGVETPVLPDEVDAADAGDGVDGLGVDGLRRVDWLVGSFRGVPQLSK